MTNWTLKEVKDELRGDLLGFKLIIAGLAEIWADFAFQVNAEREEGIGLEWYQLSWLDWKSSLSSILDWFLLFSG